MLWSDKVTYLREPFDLEADLEAGVLEVADRLFGPDRIYLDTKKRIARRGGKANIPDGYLIDLTSVREPLLYVVENEIARHEPLKHIAVQILEFSLAFDFALATIASASGCSLCLLSEAMVRRRSSELWGAMA